MIIRWTKGKDKHDTLACVREDGSRTWSALQDGFVLHDMIHYVVETTLGYKNGFYGLLAAGWDIQSFGRVDPKTGRKPAIPMEAGQVEFIVGMLWREAGNGPEPHDDFFGLLDLACAGANVPTPKITPEALDRMRADIRGFRRRWQQLPAGGHIEVEFARSRLRDRT